MRDLVPCLHRYEKSCNRCQDKTEAEQVLGRDAVEKEARCIVGHQIGHLEQHGVDTEAAWEILDLEPD